VTREAGRLDGLRLRTLEWRVAALSVQTVRSSFFDDRKNFPDGSIEFDHALIMRDLMHEWHKADDLYGAAEPLAASPPDPPPARTPGGFTTAS
jgi:hypothetical protein